VLIVVLWATLGLVSVALLFGHSMVMTYRGADNDVSGHQAEQAIEGAIRYVETLLVDANTSTPGLLPDPTSYLSDSISVGEATFFLLGRSTEASDGSLRGFGLVDEASKISLTVDPRLTGQEKTQALAAIATALKKLKGVTDEFVDAIVDWQDDDDEISESGAESETYQRFTPSYECKNAPLESLEELALLNGATLDVLYGEDTNMNGVLDPNENDGNETDPPDNTDGILDPGILEYVTLYSRESNKYTDSTGASKQRIDVTQLQPPPQQPPQELTALIEKKLGPNRVNAIHQAATVGGAPTSPLQFYFRCKQVMKAEEFALIADALTVGGGEWLYGHVNVNSASEAVLACLPGLDTSLAATIVAGRSSRGQQDANYAWVADLIDDADKIRDLGPLITGRSSAVTADIAAVGRHGRGFRREKVVIDMSTGTPRVVYRRNLAPLGWPLGIDIRDELAQLNKDTR
jgi:type II secretory pathway component PulK